MSKECPDNPRNVYPNGGCCPLCGSVEHYKRMCPDRKIREEVRVYSRPVGVDLNPDDDLYLYEEVDEKEEKRKKEEAAEKKKKKPVVVYF